MNIKKCIIVRFGAFSPSLKSYALEFYKEVSEIVVDNIYSYEFYEIVRKYYADIKSGVVEIVGVNYPFETKIDFEFFNSFLCAASKSTKNLYYYPKARADANIVRVALFCLKDRVSLDVFLLSLLQLDGKITIRAKERMQRLIYKESGYENIFRRFFPESRALFELSPFWDEFSASQEINYKNLIDRVAHFYKAPKGVGIQLHNVCNLRCSMCWFFSPIYQKMHNEATRKFFASKKEIPTNIAYEVLKYAGHYGLTTHFSAAGEPTMDKRLPDFIRFAKDAGAKRIALTTNATLLNAELSKRLLDSGLNRIYFSLDGASAETYEKTRGFKLEKTEENIKNFLELSKNYKEIEVRFNCTMEGNAINEQDKFLEKWNKYKNEIQSLNFTFVTVRKDGKDFKKDITQDKRDYARTCVDPWQSDLLLINALGEVHPSCNCPSQAKPAGGGQFIYGKPLKTIA
ncbi:MAG: radical SAM protein [Helicobacter sp.]|nr:radical SAM protein [Helicobacter sp.]